MGSRESIGNWRQSVANLTLGHSIRLSRILRKNRRTVIVPMDDSLIAGPSGHLTTPAPFLAECVSAGVDAVLGFAGTINCLSAGARVGRIFNLSASTKLSTHTKKYRVLTVDDATAYGADAVAVHVNVTSKFEADMISLLGDTIGSARNRGLPVLAIMYPRREQNGADDNYDNLRQSDIQQYTNLVAHAVRIASELGADLIKTQYTGSRETFRQVVSAALDVPVVIAGGRLSSRSDVFAKIQGALDAGAAGISIGRNLHQTEDGEAVLLRQLVDLVHNV